MDLIKKLCNEVKTAYELYLRDWLNVCGDCEAAVSARVRIKLGEIQEMWRVVTWKQVFSVDERYCIGYC